MSAYISDRGRVELVLPLLGVEDVVLRGVRVETEDRRDCLVHVKNAVNLALDTGDDNRTRKVYRRAKLAYREIVTPYEEIGADMKVYGLAIYYVLQRLTETDYLQIGGSFSKALDLFLPAVEPEEATFNYDHARARAGAEEIFRLAGDRGYYRDLNQ